MNRRDFLRTLAAAPIAPLIPLAPIAAAAPLRLRVNHIANLRRHFESMDHSVDAPRYSIVSQLRPLTTPALEAQLLATQPLIDELNDFTWDPS